MPHLDYFDSVPDDAPLLDYLDGVLDAHLDETQLLMSSWSAAARKNLLSVALGARPLPGERA